MRRVIIRCISDGDLYTFPHTAITTLHAGLGITVSVTLAPPQSRNNFSMVCNKGVLEITSLWFVIKELQLYVIPS